VRSSGSYDEWGLLWHECGYWQLLWTWAADDSGAACRHDEGDHGTVRNQYVWICIVGGVQEAAAWPIDVWLNQEAVAWYGTFGTSSWQLLGLLGSMRMMKEITWCILVIFSPLCRSSFILTLIFCFPLSESSFFHYLNPLSKINLYNMLW
jgi:hypothetical protein